MWEPQEYKQRPEFQKTVKKLKLNPAVEKHLVSSIDNWLQSEHDHLIALPTKKLLWQSKDKNVKIFCVKIPSPDRQSGKSGGYRLIVIYSISECVAEVGKIFDRRKLGFKGSSGKDDSNYDEHIADLKKEYTREPKEC